MLARLQNFRFEWKITLFTILLLPVLVSLGFWQLQREQERLELQSLYESRQGAESVALSSLDLNADLQYMPVSFSGEFINDKNFLLDNKIYDGKVGFEVITPFIAVSGERVLVNRGWIAANQYRQNLPEVEPVHGQLTLNGAVYVPLGEQFMLGEEQEVEGWPKVIQSIDMDYIRTALTDSQDIFPYTVRLDPLSPGVFVRNWTLISTTPERHRGYAIQWFSMACVLLLLYIFVSTRSVGSQKNKGETVSGQE
ncbi:MAG: hypothetical protein CMQ38_08240 [Gammaproteobacteria bacterium]|nr:hypothetical protein [Gammaproteobacteria bacterium]